MNKMSNELIENRDRQNMKTNVKIYAINSRSAIFYLFIFIAVIVKWLNMVEFSFLNTFLWNPFQVRLGLFAELQFKKL